MLSNRDTPRQQDYHGIHLMPSSASNFRYEPLFRCIFASITFVHSRQWTGPLRQQGNFVLIPSLSFSLLLLLLVIGGKFVFANFAYLAE